MNKSQSTGIWIIVTLLILSLAAMLFPGGTTSTQDISYTQFLKKVKASEIASVNIDKDVLIAKPVKEITKEEKAPNVIKQEHKPPLIQYRVMIPMNDATLYETLEANNVDVSVKKPSDSSQVFAVLSTFLPLLLIVGFIILMAKTL